MTQEEKQLLFADLSGRLPYGVKISTHDGSQTMVRTICTNGGGKVYTSNMLYNISQVKPYLRPLSSMTEEEVDEFTQFDVYANGEYIISNYKIIDWLNKHHFDYRTDDEGKTMIEKGLALKAPDGMYKEEQL